jgi:hypothetical protein
MTPNVRLRNVKSLTKFSYIGLPISSNMREQLTANRTYYVATTGNDSNNGLTVGSPFLTIQKAVDVICGTLDCSSYTVTIQVADGTYTLSSQITLYPYLGTKPVIIQGNASTPANCIINSSVAGSTLFYVASPFQWTIRGFDMANSGSDANCVKAFDGMVLIQNCRFGSTTGTQIIGLYSSLILLGGSITTYGTSGGFIASLNGANIRARDYSDYATITMSSPTYSIVVYAYGSGSVVEALWYQAGSATGKRYQADKLALVDSGGNGATYIPGSIAGTTSLGGQYG